MAGKHSNKDAASVDAERMHAPQCCACCELHLFLAPPTNSHLLRLPHDLQVDVEEATGVNSSILRCQLSEDADIHCNTTRKKKISSRPKTYF